MMWRWFFVVMFALAVACGETPKSTGGNGGSGAPGATGGASGNGGSGARGGSGGSVQEAPVSFAWPQTNAIVCTDKLWVRVEFQEPPATPIAVVLVEGIDTLSPNETDIGDLLTVKGHVAEGSVDLARTGRASLTVDGVMVAFESRDDGDEACPFCNVLEPSDDLLSAVVAEVMAGLNDPWGSVALIIDGTAKSLGCSPDPETVLFSPKAEECKDCDTEYCEEISYCGRGTSENNPGGLQGKGNSCLNRACFEHDKCYRNECVARECAFTMQGSTGDCDEKMFEKCDDKACVGRRDFAARVICKGAKGLKGSLGGPKNCENPPCALGALCCQSRPDSLETTCEAPCQVRVYEADGSWAGKIKTMCRRCFVGCGSSIQCPDPFVESVTCNPGANAGANPGNICKCM